MSNMPEQIYFALSIAFVASILRTSSGSSFCSLPKLSMRDPAEEMSKSYPRREARLLNPSIRRSMGASCRLSRAWSGRPAAIFCATAALARSINSSMSECESSRSYTLQSEGRPSPSRLKDSLTLSILKEPFSNRRARICRAMSCTMHKSNQPEWSLERKGGTHIELLDICDNTSRVVLIVDLDVLGQFAAIDSSLGKAIRELRRRSSHTRAHASVSLLAPAKGARSSAPDDGFAIPGREDLAVGAHLEHGGEGEPVLARLEGAKRRGQLLRKHRACSLDEVDCRASSSGLSVQCGAA